MSRFPPPEEAKRKEGPTLAPSEPKARVVVTRAEPAADPATEKKEVKLTPEEVRALLAVGDATRDKSKAQVLWKRGRVIVIPLGLLDIALHLFFGHYAWIAVGVVTIAGLVWMARPLFRKEGWD